MSGCVCVCFCDGYSKVEFDQMRMNRDGQLVHHCLENNPGFGVNASATNRDRQMDRKN